MTNTTRLGRLTFHVDLTEQGFQVSLINPTTPRWPGDKEIDTATSTTLQGALRDLLEREGDWVEAFVGPWEEL